MINAHAMVKLGVIDLSAQPSIDIAFVPLYPGNFRQYSLAIDDLRPSADGIDLWLRTSADDITYDSGASDYGWNQFADFFGGTLPNGAAFDSKIQLANAALGGMATSGSASPALAGDVTITPGDGTEWPMVVSRVTWANPTATFITSRLSGFRRAAAQLAAVRLMTSSGTMSGRITVYGLAGDL